LDRAHDARNKAPFFDHMEADGHFWERKKDLVKKGKKHGRKRGGKGSA